jgi:hypothetical protein
MGLGKEAEQKIYERFRDKWDAYELSKSRNYLEKYYQRFIELCDL